MKDRRLVNIYNNIYNSDDPMLQYISFFLESKKDYKHFLLLYQDAIKLLKEGFPFEKINKKFFKIIEAYCGRDEQEIWDFFCNLYNARDYDIFASFLSDIGYSYTFLNNDKNLQEANPEFYSLFNTFVDIMELINGYVRGEESMYISEVAFSLLAVAWIDGLNNFDHVYAKVKDIINADISIEDFCLLTGIRIDVITTKKSIFIAKEICNYSRLNRVIK